MIGNLVNTSYRLIDQRLIIIFFAILIYSDICYPANSDVILPTLVKYFLKKDNNLIRNGFMFL